MRKWVKIVVVILAALGLTVLLSNLRNLGSEPVLSELSSDNSGSTSTSLSVSNASDNSYSVRSDSDSESGAESSSDDHSDNISGSSSESSLPDNSSSKPYTGGTPASSAQGLGDSAMAVIPKAEQTARVNGERITFTADDVFSEGQYYSVMISGAKMANQSAGVSNDTTYIDGILYGDFRLDLYKAGTLADTLKINVPADDSFLILEDLVGEKKNNGFMLRSHKEEFSDDSYPDLVQLDFKRQEGMAVPEYARYFAVFDGKLDEIRFYDNGNEVAPIGTKAKMRGDGIFTQNLTIQDGKGGYTVIKFEYSLDLDRHRFNRKQVRFTGWED